MSVRLSQSLSERRRGHDGGVTDAPAYRIWPPIALGVPLLIGVIVTAVAGDPFTLARDGARVVGAVLFAVFGIWNGWTLTVPNTDLPPESVSAQGARSTMPD